VEVVVREEQQDYELNPSLMIACVDDIRVCSSSGEASKVMSCLEEKFLSGKIESLDCKLVSITVARNVTMQTDW